MLWDEENRLMAADVNGYVSNYTYDAGGERVTKLAGGGQGIFVNSAFSGGKTATDNFTLYVNPYLVAQSGGRYTKHIYVGSQRIVSKLGDFDSYGADPRRVEKAGESFSGVKVDYEAKYKKALAVVKENYAAFEVPYYGLDNNDFVNGLGFCCNPNGETSGSSPRGKMTAKNDNAELQQFYYHPDHLGSSSYLTNLDGEVVQHIEYVPFGEVFLEEKNAKWNTPYLFTSKELDKETGLYYYGARYMDPKLSTFISVDPLAEKYPNVSPYTYCFNNPIAYVDPDGQDGILIVFPDYKIATPVGKLGSLGHAGVLLIDNKSGITKYYEFGRYDKEGKGLTRTVPVSNVVIGKDGKPTTESLNKVLGQISKKSGQGTRIEGAYIESSDYEGMKKYAEGKIELNKDANRKEYSLTNNNCGTFACDVLNQDPKVDQKSPSIVDPRPNSIVDEYQNTFKKVEYNPSGTNAKKTESKTQTNKSTYQKTLDKLKSYF